MGGGDEDPDWLAYCSDLQECLIAMDQLSPKERDDPVKVKKIICKNARTRSSPGSKLCLHRGIGIELA